MFPQRNSRSVFLLIIVLIFLGRRYIVWEVVQANGRSINFISHSKELLFAHNDSSKQFESILLYAPSPNQRDIGVEYKFDFVTSSWFPVQMIWNDQEGRWELEWHTMRQTHMNYDAVYIQSVPQKYDPRFNDMNCPPRPSIISQIPLTFTAPNTSIDQIFITPVFIEGELCFFAVVGASETLDQFKPDAPFVIVEAMPKESWLGNGYLWDFAAADNLLGWQVSPNSNATALISQGGLSLTSYGDDPYVFIDPLRIHADDVRTLEITLKTEVDTSLEIFWASSALPVFLQANSISVAVAANNDWQTYDISLSDHLQWDGIITKLRLDPLNQNGLVTIQSVVLR